jgi:hypothetical protein
MRTVLMSLCGLIFLAQDLCLVLQLAEEWSIDHELVGPPPMEEAKDSLELHQEILGEIFSLLEIPDLVRAGCVCSSWHTAHTSLRNSELYKRQ